MRELPWTGSNYSTARAAHSAAENHAKQHRQITVLTIPTGAHPSA